MFTKRAGLPVLVLITALLAACGGSSGSSSSTDQTANTQSAPVSARAPAKTVVIDAQGDSTMYGFQTSDNFQKSWQTANNPPALLQAQLQAQFGTVVTVINNGVPGATLGERMDGLAGVTSYAQQIAAQTAQVVIVNFAINDANPGNAYHETPDQFRNYLIQFIATSQAAGRIVVLEEPNPVTDPTINAAIANMVQVTDQVALQMNLPLVKQYDYILSLPNWQTLLIDGVHPTDALYEVKEQREADVVLPIVQKLEN